MTVATSKSYRFLLGDVECFSICDGNFNYPVASFFSNVSEAQLTDGLRQQNLPLNYVSTPYACLLINTGQHRIMVDTGAGNLASIASRFFPTVDHSTTVTGQLLENLKTAGFRPPDIDMVIITHAHPDHIGGNLDNAGELVFANARYFIARDEWNFWTSDAASTEAPLPMVQIARRNLQPLRDRLTFVEDASEIAPGIKVIATPGHTPGHIALSVDGGGQQLLHVSDVVLHPLHLLYPKWQSGFDINPGQAEQSKHSLFNRAAQEQALVFAHHFPPFPNLGHVLPTETGWQWHPIDVGS